MLVQGLFKKTIIKLVIIELYRHNIADPSVLALKIFYCVCI